MSAYKFSTIPGLAVAIRQATAEASEILKSNGRGLIEIKTADRSRTVEQNKLQRKWMNEAAEQGDCTAEEYRAYCKLHFGVAILTGGSDEFAVQWESVMRHLPYEAKLKAMAEPFDFPVTRLMTAKQKAAYLNQIYQHFTGLGFKLTEPKRKGRA